MICTLFNSGKGWVVTEMAANGIKTADGIQSIFRYLK